MTGQHCHPCTSPRAHQSRVLLLLVLLLLVLLLLVLLLLVLLILVLLILVLQRPEAPMVVAVWVMVTAEGVLLVVVP